MSIPLNSPLIEQTLSARLTAPAKNALPGGVVPPAPQPAQPPAESAATFEQQLAGVFAEADAGSAPAAPAEAASAEAAVDPVAAKARQLACRAHGIPSELADLISAEDLDGAAAQAAKIAELLNGRQPVSSYVIGTEGHQPERPTAPRDALGDALKGALGIAR